MPDVSNGGTMASHVKLDKAKFQKIRELSGQKTFPWLADAILDWALIGLMFYFINRYHSLPIIVGSMLIIGNRQHALAILGHDGAHYTVSSNRSLNDFLSNLLSFWPLLITTEGYRDLHFKHHKNVGSTDDPEILHKGARSPQWNLPLQKKKIALYAVKDLFGYSLPDLLILLTFAKPSKLKYFLPVLLLHACFLVASLLSGSWWIPLVWYSSLTTTFMMFFRLRIWLEHMGTTSTQRLSLTPIQGMVFAPHKAWLHWEHHQCPTVPYHRLAVVRSILPGPEPLRLAELLKILENAPSLPSGALADV
jgi:fatty acid desaturase